MQSNKEKKKDPGKHLKLAPQIYSQHGNEEFLPI